MSSSVWDVVVLGMRSEIKFIRRNGLRRRYKYIADLDGKHRKKNLDVRLVWIGVSGADEFFNIARAISSRRRGPGAPLLFIAWEMTVHPMDRHGPKRAFVTTDEMIRVARELVKQMHGRVALVGCHGLQDLHVVLLNDGPTGLGLKSYLPNRSNPRRVMVAVVDRVEAELNEQRALSNLDKMIPMVENRAVERRRLGRVPLIETLLKQVSTDKEPDVAALLEAFRTCGWKANVKKRENVLAVRFDSRTQRYEFDSFYRAVLKQWWTRSRERQKKQRDLPPPYEAITAALFEWRAANRIPAELGEWLSLDDGVVTPTARLRERMCRTPESLEMLAALEAHAKAESDLRHSTRKRIDEMER